jgi:hypothetical protein
VYLDSPASPGVRHRVDTSIPGWNRRLGNFIEQVAAG